MNQCEVKLYEKFEDKSLWGQGPWLEEPNRLEWRHEGLPCLILRSFVSGSLCGYVAVTKEHPWYGKKIYDDPLDDVGIHGGLSYADACGGQVCHTPQEGEPDDVWWVGFDCGHAFDYTPKLRALIKSAIEMPLPPYKPTEFETYRDINYVRAEVESLAKQALEAQP